MTSKKHGRSCLDLTRWFPDLSDATLRKCNAAAGITVPDVPAEFSKDRVGDRYEYEVVQLLPGERIYGACPEWLGYRLKSVFAWVWHQMVWDRPDDMRQLLRYWDQLLADGRDAIWVKLAPKIEDAHDQKFWIEGTDAYPLDDAGTILIGEWLYRFTDWQGLEDAVEVMAHQFIHCLQVADGSAAKMNRQYLELNAIGSDIAFDLESSRKMWGLMADNSDIMPNDRPKVESPMTEWLADKSREIAATRAQEQDGDGTDGESLGDSA